MKELFNAFRSSAYFVAPYFIVSRALFFLILYCSAAISINSVPSREGLNYHVTSDSDPSLVMTKITKTLLSGDPSWYMEIARYGYPIGDYQTSEARHWVFFPAYPLIVRALTLFSGSYLGTAVLLNMLLFFVALCFLSEYLKDTIESSARNFVIAAFAFHPMSYFFSLPQTESLFFCSLMGVLLLLKSGRSGMSLVIFSAILFCSRPTSLLMIPVLLYLISAKSSDRYRLLFSITIGFLSFILFSLYLYHLTGSAFTWMTHQKIWGRVGIGNDLNPLNIKLLSSWNFNALHIYFLILAIFAAIYFFRFKKISCSLMLIAPIIVILQSGGLMSITRILMPLFPIQLFLGEVLKSEISRRMYLFASCFLYGMLALLFCIHVTLAMA